MITSHQFLRVQFDERWRFEKEGNRVVAEAPVEAAEELRVSLGLAIRTFTNDTASIKRAVCAEFSLLMSEMDSDMKPNRIAFPRQVAMWLHRTTISHITFAEIGARFPKENGQPRDHGTVVHACNRVQDVMSTDETMRARILAVRGRLSDGQCEQPVNNIRIHYEKNGTRT